MEIGRNNNGNREEAQCVLAAQRVAFRVAARILGGDPVDGLLHTKDHSAFSVGRLDHDSGVNPDHARGFDSNDNII